MPPQPPLCAITGAHGFVGSRLKHFLQSQGWCVVPWTRKPESGSSSVAFTLGQQVDPTHLHGVQALVHCAYDFAPSAWNEITAINVAGTDKLLTAARQANVPSVVVISTLSAFDGCRSLYGKAKLQIESLARSNGAFVIRPGLVYGECQGGMFGRLVNQVRSSSLIPVLWGGRQSQYLVQDQDLGNLVHGCLGGRVPKGIGPVTIAHEQPWELKEILAQIARTLDKRVSFVPLPWQSVWLALKTLEIAGVRPKFKSDSLISMIYQDPAPSFALLQSLGFKCRPFEVSPAMLASAST
jgi:nucleoside-diphosphate-sugar epimerase